MLDIEGRQGLRRRPKLDDFVGKAEGHRGDPAIEEITIRSFHQADRMLDGFPFSPKNPYTYGEGKRLLKLAMIEFERTVP
jgi:hypothetical protein